MYAASRDGDMLLDDLPLAGGHSVGTATDGTRTLLASVPAGRRAATP